jgi:hypothetical protein
MPTDHAHNAILNPKTVTNNSHIISISTVRFSEFNMQNYLLVDIYEILFTSWTNDVWQFGVGVTGASWQRWH